MLCKLWTFSAFIGHFSQLFFSIVIDLLPSPASLTPTGPIIAFFQAGLVDLVIVERRVLAILATRRCWMMHLSDTTVAVGNIEYSVCRVCSTLEMSFYSARLFRRLKSLVSRATKHLRVIADICHTDVFHADPTLTCVLL